MKHVKTMGSAALLLSFDETKTDGALTRNV
jgi:hypothetical protein